VTEIKNDDINKRGRKMIRVGIIGATGYAGGELVRILLNHKDAKIVWYGSRSYIDKKYYQVYQNMFQLVEDICKDDNLEELAKQVDVIFTATPQGFLAGLLTEEILSQVKIVDLSADYRIKDVATYEKWNLRIGHMQVFISMMIVVAFIKQCVTKQKCFTKMHLTTELNLWYPLKNILRN
jgi:dihydrodipicolinate reductase